MSPRIKSIFLLAIFVIISLILVPFLTLEIYDKNYYLNYGEKKILSITQKDNSTDIQKDNSTDIQKENSNFVIFNYYERITAADMLSYLFFLKDSSADFVVLNANFDYFKDYYDILRLKKFVKNEKKVYGFIKINKNKGRRQIKYQTRNKENLRNFLYLNSDSAFNYANYNGKILLNNGIGIPSTRIGFIYDNINFLDTNNIDFLIKYGNKYLLSLPFLIYLNNNGKEISNISFSLLSLKTGDNTSDQKLFYDQKGKMSYLHNESLKENDNIFYFGDWKKAFEVRSNIINKLKSIGLFSSTASDYQLYGEEEKRIDSIYSIPRQKNKDKDSTLSIAKNYATQWKTFKSTVGKSIFKNGVLLTDEKNNRLVSIAEYRTRIMKKGQNLIRIPISLIVVLILVIFLLLFFFGFKGSNLLVGILSSVFLIFEITIFYLFQRFLHTDLPISAVLVSSFLGVIFGILSKYIINYIWFREVKLIFKGSVSQKMARRISSRWRRKEWNLDSQRVLSTFMYIDTSIFLKKDIEEDDVEFISQMNSKIERTIKNNNGVRNNFDSNHISCYFGNPLRNAAQANDAIATARDILAIPEINVSDEYKYYIAIHSQQEWFEYHKSIRQKIYTYFGNSLNILGYMIEIAKKFGVQVLITETTFKLSGGKISVRLLDRIAVKGISGSLRLLQLLPENLSKGEERLTDYFHAGIKLFEEKKWDAALKYFKQCLKINSEDIPSQIYATRCKEFIEIPPKSDWDVIYEVD